MSKKDFWEGYVPEPDKRQQALDKKAENARELGLDYEPAQPEPADDQLVWIVVAFIAFMLTLLTIRSCL